MAEFWQERRIEKAYKLIRDLFIFTNKRLKIWISGSELPIQKQFNRSLDIYELQRVLAEYVLK